MYLKLKVPESYTTFDPEVCWGKENGNISMSEQDSKVTKKKKADLTSAQENK